MPEKKTAFNLMLDDRDRRRLQALAKNMEMSQGGAIRFLLAAANAHECGRPTCANGHSCYVPQMHIAARKEED